MPWCEDCSRFYNPNTLDEQGDCPSGHRVAEPSTEVPHTVPWHFWLMLVALAIYLAWRVIQGIGLLL